MQRCGIQNTHHSKESKNQREQFNKRTHKSVVSHTEVQYWHVSPQCQFSAKCLSGQGWHSVGVLAVQCCFTAMPGGHWSHSRRSEVTGSRCWYLGGVACCWKAQEREAVKSCKREKQVQSPSKQREIQPTTVSPWKLGLLNIWGCNN